MREDESEIAPLILAMMCLVNAFAPLSLASPASSEPAFPLVVEYTVEYHISAPAGSDYDYTLWVEVYDIPAPARYQEVSANLEEGHLENIGGNPVWVIQKYIKSGPPTRVTLTGTFTVAVDLRRIPPIPHIPVEPPEGMQSYLAPDEYVTLSPPVRELAASLISQAENDLPAVISEFVNWIRGNITYSREVGENRRMKDYEVLQARAGTCDEFSTLFVGLCRSVGIPARYVTGYLVGVNPPIVLRPGSGHAWAEVWAGDMGLFGQLRKVRDRGRGPVVSGERRGVQH
jgi:transglutaminase-like putative cysteine protease